MTKMADRDEGRESGLVVCGLRVETNLAVAMEADNIAPDGDCYITFGSATPASFGWHAVAGSSVSPDGRHAVIPIARETDVLRAVQVRHVAPFAAALQGKVTLHGSCVGSDHRAYAFVGESGAGKSTFAAILATRDWRRICDDLLPVRPDADRWIVPALPSRLELAGVYFLERAPSTARLEVVPLAPRDALLLLLRHGFGELPDSGVWRRQFEAYAGIGRTVPCYRLLVPHDLARLPQAARAWSQYVGSGRIR
jgi:hypothetical protein